MTQHLIPVSGVFYRLVFSTTRNAPITAAKTPQGRFHYNGQPALYMSPTKEWAAKALKVYVRPDDPPREFISLNVTGAKILDLREASVRQAFQISLPDVRAHWREETANGSPGSSWKVSDRARELKADGLFYPSRTELARWNLVLFRWNKAGAPSVEYAD